MEHSENSLKKYGKAHIMFVQAIMQKGILNSKEVGDLFKICCKRGKIYYPPETNSISAKHAFLTCINEKLKKIGFLIKNCYDEAEMEADGHRKGFLAFVNRTDRSKETNGMTLKAMVTFQPFEIEYLKVIVHAIMNTEHRIVNSTTALNAFRQVKSRKFDINLAEKIITKFHQHKWLILDNRSGKIRFHARFLAEMEDWLRDVYPDQLLKCSKCNKTVLKSKKCPNVDCNGVFHMYCIYDKKSKVKGKCTKCGTEINMKPPSSATQTQENEPSGRSRTRSKAGAKRKRFIAEEDSETEEEEDETYSEESEESNN